MDIDPIQYGKFLEKVNQLEEKIDKLECGMEELLALANRSKGAFFFSMGMAAVVASFITWIVELVAHR